MCTGEIAKKPLRSRGRDIVDTTFHASRAAGQISALESALPTIWEGQTSNRGIWAAGMLMPGSDIVELMPGYFPGRDVWEYTSPCCRLSSGIIESTSGPPEVLECVVHAATMPGLKPGL